MGGLSRCIVVVLACAASAFGGVARADTKSGVFQRVAVCGASVSAGFGVTVQRWGPVPLAEVIDAALRVPHGPVKHFAAPLFFLTPENSAKRQVGRVLKMRATCLFALDFLFWFGYGRVRTEEERLRRLDRGLTLLSKVPCLSLVGDLPDMSQSVGRMLRAYQVPLPGTLKILNAKIRTWASGREKVVVVSLRRLLERLKRGHAVTVGSVKVRFHQIFQRDRLHPNLKGSAALVVYALCEAASLRPKLVSAEAFLHDPGKIVAALTASVKKQVPSRKRERGTRKVRAHSPGSSLRAGLR